MAIKTSYFPKPYEDQASGWEDLTQDQQNIWRQWALGVKVQDTDFRDIIRGTPAAYALIAPNAYAERSDPINPAFPPPSPIWHPGLVQPNLVEVTNAPSAKLWLTSETTDLSFWSVWSSPYYVTGAQPDLNSLQWITSVRVEAAEGPGLGDYNFAPDLSAVVGSPATQGGNWLTFFWFEGSNGQLRYQGASPVQVGV